ncbi:NAD(P)/FAD-dependent oxidoreductase [Georgenia daeguensis]|uniref:flavin-containing monooxygenase n=1 Tax=Georgenia daeguensis TaxID=908355 RepID=UPI0031EB1498
MVDAVVVGAGLAGVSALYHLRRQGIRVLVLEASDGIGGTWYHNRYPGARCDIESLDYSYSFSEELQQDWHWSERYASQQEILAYVQHVVDRFDLRKDIELNARVVSAVFDETDGRWAVRTENGQQFSAKYCLLATGVLSAAQVPQIRGTESFQGRSYHTADWPTEGVDLSGDRVGVIGTGSSGTQLIPLVAEQAAHLYVFQRTPNFVMPAQNRPMDPDLERHWKEHYPELRKKARATRNGHNQISNPLRGKDVSPEERRAEFERRWELGGLYMMRAFADILTDPEVNAEAGDFAREKIRQIVDDPATAEALMPPRELALGTKRLCSGTNYYETYNRDNVTLVNLREAPIEAVTPTGIRTADGSEYELDVIVYATGFDAMTGSFLRIDVRGRGGLSLREKWQHGPRTYLGVMTHGFPNLFILAGPQTPSVFSNMVNQAEIHVEWVNECIAHLEKNEIDTIEANEDAENAWVDHVNELASRTLYAQSRNSWFWGANTPGKPRVFMPYVGGIDRYLQKLGEVVAHGYEGFTLRSRQLARA